MSIINANRRSEFGGNRMVRAGRAIARHAPSVAFAAVVAVVAVMAVNADGQKVQRVEANNAAIWVTNNDGGRFGRFNKASSKLELQNQAGSDGTIGDVAVRQDGNSVVVLNLSAGTMYGVDTATGVDGHEQPASLPAGAIADLRGGTFALVDPASGKVWATRTGGSSHVLDLSALAATSAPLAELGPLPAGLRRPVGLSVGADGSIHAASASGKQVSISPTELGFANPQYSQLPGQSLSDVQVAALGGSAAVFDASSGQLILPGGRTAQLPTDLNATIQQGGADVGSVAVATSSGLYAVSYDASVQELFTRPAPSTPAEPVNLGSSSASGHCILAAWSGDPGQVVRSCNGAAGVDVSGKSPQRLDLPYFQVNWGLVVLNDRADGRIYDVDLQQSFQDWNAIRDLENQQQQQQEEETKTPTDALPKARPDSYGARPNRTSVLHVLDNDVDPNGKILAISKVEQPSGGAAKVLVSPDGQTLQLQQPLDGKDTSFSYTISNGKGEATARVVIKAENGTEDQDPKPREHYTEPVYPVAPAGTVSIPVADDFRDFDGDPITVVSAKDGDQSVPVTADGLIEYTAPEGQKTVQRRTIAFELRGSHANVKGSVEVHVSSDEDLDGTGPVARPDAVKGEVGKPISVLPLANDIPGVDPASEDTKLTLADDVAGWKGAKVTTDRVGGRVTFVAENPGTFWVPYTAGFGSAATDDGLIRVDVVDKVSADPIAMPDQAVIRGDQAITVDVLANDSDPHGGLLTVQQVTPSDPKQLQVAVVQGRWLRVVPSESAFTPNPQSISYQVVNGEGATATGSLTVTRLDAIEDRPIARGDTATVRAGDSVLIPVLANDYTLGGSNLTLATSAQGSKAGELPVIDPVKSATEDQGDVGTAFVVGNQVRYLAPATVTAPLTVNISYQAMAGVVGAEGVVAVTINPEPTDAVPDSPPRPVSVEARVASGDTITIPISASGQDPDGDSVALVGLAEGPKLGRVTRITPKGITYQAFPTDEGLGTDQFQYLVTDKYGQTGAGVIRLAVVQPGQTQVPIAVDDLIQAKPGAKVNVDVMANDLLAANDRVRIKPLVSQPAGVELLGEQGPITATAPAASDEATTITYTLTGNGGDGNIGTVRVIGVDGFLNPPRVKDQLATSDGKLASVDVLADAWDPDGNVSDLTVESVSDPEAKVAGGTVSVPLAATPRVLSYTVRDLDGARSSALIYVPGDGTGAPHVTGTISIDPGRTSTVALADVIASTRGKPVRITVTNSVGVSPSSHLKVKPSSDLTQVELAADDYIGPANLNLEVTDGTSLTDPDGLTAVLSVPIQVGPPTPVLRCPSDPQTITRGAASKAMDLIGLCHVWTANPADQAGIVFAANWKAGADLAAVTPSLDGQSLVLQAGGNSKPGATGTLEITVPGTNAKPGELNIVVKDAPAARFKAQQLEVKQGEQISGTIALQSEISLDRKDTIVAMPDLPNATESFDGANWKVTADPNFVGRLSYDLTLTDVPGAADREIHGRLEISVYGIPAVPGAPRGGKLAQSHAVTLTWDRPDSNGASITAYKVLQHGGRNDGKEYDCKTEQCTIKDLDNDVPVTFQVKAYNKAGWSEYGIASREIIPDDVPSSVTGFTTSDPLDKKITLSWNRVSGDFSEVLRYEIRWPGGKDHAGASESSKTVSVKANKKTTFSIWAVNRTGKSKKAATVEGWPTGDPTPFEVQGVSADLDVNETVATVAWAAAGPNGKGPTLYSVSHNGSPVGKCQRQQSTKCVVGGITLDGTDHHFTVEAQNFYQHKTTADFTWKAIGRPGDWSSDLTLTETGQDHQFTLSTTTPNSRGQSATLTINAGGKMTTMKVTRTGEKLNLPLEVPSNGQEYTVTLKLCNEVAEMGCATKSGSVSTYGPLPKPSITMWTDRATGRFRVSNLNGNGRAATLVVTSSRGFSQTYNIDANGNADIEGAQDVGWSTSVSFSAHLEPKGGQSRGNSGTDTAGPQSTMAKPNPTANFSLGPEVGGTGTYRNWYYADVELSGWNPNSTVRCGAQSTQTDLNDWSQDFGVNSDGYRGTTTTTLKVANSGALPNTSFCAQR